MDKWFPFFENDLRYHCWGDEAVVFNPFTGETHQVGLFAIELLSSLDPGQGLALDDIYARLADVFVDFGPDESRQMIEGALSQLEAHSLVKRILI